MAVSGSGDDPDLHHELLADDPGLYHFFKKRFFGQYDLAGADLPQL